MIRKIGSSLLVAAALLAVTASPALAERATLLAKHVPQAVASGSVPRLADMDPEQKLDIVLALPTRNQPELDQLLKDLQDPSSPRYHKYINPQQYTERFAATQADYDKVVAFAKANGFENIETTTNRHLVIAKTTVANINRVFKVNMGIYQHPTENRTFFSTDREPTISGLDVKLVEVAGLNNMVRPHNYLKHKPETTSDLGMVGAADETADVVSHTGSGPSGQYLPSDMRAAYYGGTTLTGSGVTVAIVGYGSIQASDLTLFTTKTGESLPIPITYPTFSQSTTACEGGGSSGTGCDDGEQTLDVEQVNGMAPGAKQIYFYAAEYNSDTSDLPMINAIANDDLGMIVTCSWGWTPTNQTSEDASFQQMQAQGQTFLNATGDSGYYTTSNIYYPSANPYITEVGGTDLTTVSAGGAWKSETAWVDSSGGYSPVASLQYPIPAWQALSGVINSSNKGSTTLRNDPDVAAEANFDNYICDDGTCSTGYGGTSFATPRWAGFLALVEQQSIADGNGQLGFFPPLLYRIGVSSTYGNNIHDITSGNNGKKGFTAVTGYDDVTGWGSPNGATLISTLAAPVFGISPTSGTTATSFNTTITYPDISGTATFYAKVGTSGTPTSLGTCTLTTGATSTTCSSSFTGSVLGVGTYNGYVSYVESATYNGTTRSVTKTSGLTSFTITDPTSVTALATPSTITTAQSSTISVVVADTATSTIVPSGSVSFKTGSTSLGGCTLNSGTCSVSVAGSTLGVGSYTITPTYTGTGFTTGTTTPASLTVNSVPTNVITFTSVTHNFGTVNVGTAATAYTLAVKNTSTTTAYPFVLNFTAGNGFTSATNCPSTIAAGASCELAFYFTPTATGTVTNSWSLASENGFTYSPSNGGTLTGSGTSQGGLALSTAGHNWGTVAVGTTSAAYGVTLSNSTSSAVTLTLGSVSSPFAAVTNCGATLAAGASCQFQFTFTPTSTATVSQTYSVSAGGVTITSGGNTVTGIVLTGN